MTRNRFLIIFGLIWVAILLLVIFLKAPEAQDLDSLVRVSRVLRVYDGDTFYAEVDGWPLILGQSIGIRIRGIDTPEIRGTSTCVKAMAYKSREELVKLLTGSEIYLYNMQRGKYFRIIATVRVNGYNITEGMVQSGKAKAWDGRGRRPTWECQPSWFTIGEMGNILRRNPTQRNFSFDLPYDDE